MMNRFIKQWPHLLVLTIVVVLASMLLAGCRTSSSPYSDNTAANGDGPTDMCTKWGIESPVICLSAGGYMLDFRYNVTDPEKAKYLLSRKVIPYLCHKRTGAKLMVPSSPKVGPLRQTTRKPRKGGRYYVIFANPGVLVKDGDVVTVVIGDFRQDVIVGDGDVNKSGKRM